MSTFASTTRFAAVTVGLASATKAGATTPYPPTLAMGFPFDGASDNPRAGLTLGTPGPLCGTTSGSVAWFQDFGDIYRYSAVDGSADLVDAFHSGDGMGTHLSVGLKQAHVGAFYGTTSNRTNPACYDNGAVGCGVVFRATAECVETPLLILDVSNGWEPFRPPTEGDGNFYGTTYRGPFNLGTNYQMAPDGTLTMPHSFSGAGCDGASPTGKLVLVLTWRSTERPMAAVRMGRTGTVFRLAFIGKVKTLSSVAPATAVGRS